MEKDLKVLEDLKLQIEKARSNFKKSPKERITEGYVVARLEGLEEVLHKFVAKHEQLITQYDKTILDCSSYMKNDSFNVTYETYIVYKGELKTTIKSLASQMEDNCSSSPGTSKESLVRLPKISIPIFSGNYSEWASFKDLFISLVNNNTSLDDVQRLHYLKTQVKGEAEQLLKNIPITQLNYKKCWEILSNRYDNKRFMSNFILKRLFNQVSINCESSKALKDLLDTSIDCLHELENLGINVKSWDVIVIFILSSKLDVETRKQWELHVTNVCHDLPSFDIFKEFLQSRFRALEFIEPTKNKVRNSQNISPKVLHVTNTTVTCPHCNDNHKLYSCGKFANEHITARQNIVKSLGLCFNCLGNGHLSKNCRIHTKCRVCKGKHHTMLHGKHGQPRSWAVTEELGESSHTEPAKSTVETNVISNHFVTKNIKCGYKQTLLATALIKAETCNGHHQILRALLDQGSQASFISEAAVQLLRLKKTAVRSCISGLGGSGSNLISKYVVMINIRSRYDPTFQLSVKAYVLNTVTSILPEKKFILSDWTELDNVKLADPQYNTPNKIDILLGSEVYCSILKRGLIKNPTGTMIAQDTHLGWILSGQVNCYSGLEQASHNIILNMHVKVDSNELLKKFWELESEPQSQANVLSLEEQACEEHFKNTTTRDKCGRYIVELPFRSNVKQDFGDTRSVAVKRWISLEHRLDKNLELKGNYSQVLREYLDLGHMERVDGQIKQAGASVWLPHHAVIRTDKSTTKTRVVFNASDRSANGVSLNDTLMVGPKLQPDLRSTIMRWRQYPVCLTADIVKMYRQVKVTKEHADYQRIVWREGDADDIHDYRLLTVTFGTSSAPYLAVKVLQQIALDEGHNFPRAASRVKTDFYMDDLLTGCQSEKEALLVYEEMNALLRKGGFILQKWASNREELLKSLNECSSPQDRIFTEDNITKVVGLTWNRRTDEFDYRVKLLPDSMVPETKRGVISEICRLYDPLGWIAPCVVTAKILIQKLWLTGLEWDDYLPDALINEWAKYRLDLLQLCNFHIPRWIHTGENDRLIELHGFSDASQSAYAAVVYVRSISTEGEIRTHLVTAKSKVAPIKQVSIPRLELCGAVLVAKLLIDVAEILKIDRSKLHAWTDSTIVLAWLSDNPSRWKTFVANRTSEILCLLDSSQWSYVQSTENPADCASRGLSPSELVEHSLWKFGPQWLREEDIEYSKPLSICTKTDLEAKLIKSHSVLTDSDDEEDNSIICRFSSLRRLVRVVAYCRRFLYMRDATFKNKILPYLTATEIQDSTECCIRQHQCRWFKEEISALRKNKPVNNKSKLVTLNAFIDKNNILRVGGRIENSNLPECSKHPIIVHSGSHFAKILILDAHERTMHGGQQLTCNYIRSKYWVINLKNKVRAMIHNCVTCIRYTAKTKTQLMGQLPSCRVTPQKPFLHSGVDYAGPINIRLSKGRGNKAYRGYICLFVCMATRAVHIEAVSDLTTEGFLSAFRRFVSRRGRCLQLWSDNGSNFVGAARELKTLFANERSSLLTEIASSLANNGTEWRFIPPHAPNFGGLWEAGIKSTKYHLRRVIGDSTLTFEELSTVLAQIEACLNSRPLSHLSPDPDDPVPLTPGSFIVGEPLVVVPSENFEFSKENSLRRWQLTQRMLQHFWKRWSQEYLTHFFQRYKWRSNPPELKIDDVVLVKEDNLPPAKWLYGRVIKVHPGRDNIIRVVTLKCKGSLIQRPTSKLCALPVKA